MSTPEEAGPLNPAQKRLSDIWPYGMEFELIINRLRNANVPEEGPDRWNIAEFRRNADVIVPPEHAEDAAWATAKINLAKRGAKLLAERAKGSQVTAAQSQSGKGPKRAREDVTPAAASAAKKAKQVVDPDAVAARLASAALELEDARKFQQLWLEGVTSESRVMKPMLMKISNSLKTFNFQLSALAKLVL